MAGTASGCRGSGKITGGLGRLQSMNVLLHPAKSGPLMFHDMARLVSLGVWYPGMNASVWFGGAGLGTPRQPDVLYMFATVS